MHVYSENTWIFVCFCIERKCSHLTVTQQCNTVYEFINDVLKLWCAEARLKPDYFWTSTYAIFPSLILVLVLHPSKMLMLTENRSSSTNVTVILNYFPLERFGVPGSKTNSLLLCPSAQHILLTTGLTALCTLSNFLAFCLHFDRKVQG